MTFPTSIDRHTLALTGIVGSAFDVLGALYLAYDLLGGEHGPLRTLTRAVTYGILYGAGYGLALGPAFGLATGLTHGITLAFEYSRASRREPTPGFWTGFRRDTAMSAIRGCGFALGASWSFGVRFGIVFGALSTAGQAIGYQLGIRPTVGYRPATRPRITRFLLLAALNRAVGYTAAGYLSSLVAQQRQHAIAVGLRTGLSIGIVTAVIGSCTPFVEWTADHLPERRMGVLGIGLILIGFTLQSAQYWATLLGIDVR